MILIVGLFIIQLEMAYKYYEEAIAKEFALSSSTYDAMIRATNYLHDNWRDRWNFIKVRF